MFPPKIPRNIKHDARRPQKWENRAPLWANVIPKAPTGNQSAPKVSQKGAKVSQNAAKGSQNAAKREPKGDQNTSKSRPSERNTKRMPKGSPHLCDLGGFWEPLSIKNQWTNRCENLCRKSDENWWKIDAKNGPFFLYFSRNMFM